MRKEIKMKKSELQKWRDFRKQSGLCGDCSNKAELGKTKCKKCQKKATERVRVLRAERKKQGLCRCGAKTKDKCVCKNKIYYRSMRDKRLGSNLCVRCGRNEPITNKTCCVKCYLQYTARSHLKDSTKWQNLEMLFKEQNGLCPYTGMLLTLGINTELDHITAKAKGRGVLDNFQWIYTPINYMKQDLTENEFIELCKKVTIHRQ